jgi:EF hand
LPAHSSFPRFLKRRKKKKRIEKKKFCSNKKKKKKKKKKMSQRGDKRPHHERGTPARRRRMRGSSGKELPVTVQSIKVLDKAMTHRQVMATFRSKMDDVRCMSYPQFRRFLAYHTDRDISFDELEDWQYASNEHDCISLKMFRMIYTLWDNVGDSKTNRAEAANYTFRAIDLDRSGMIERDEFDVWARAAVRTGYLELRCATEESPDICFDRTISELYSKFDANHDGLFDPSEFASMLQHLQYGINLGGDDEADY